MKISLETWLRSAILDDKDGKCTLLTCNHVIGSNLDEVQTHKLGGSNPLTERELSEMFTGRARVHCQELPGTQLFRMLAFYEGRSEPQNKFHFRVQGETDFDGVVTESADTKGLLGQQMRLFEANTSSTFRKDAMLFETMIRSNQIMSDNNVKLTQQVMESMRGMADMTAAFLKAQSEGRIEEIRLKAQFQERQMLIGFAPHLLNAATGKNIIPESSTEESVFLELANTLNEDEFKAMMAILGNKNPRLAAIIANKLSAALQKQRIANEDESRIANVVDPEEDAGGTAH